MQLLLVSITFIMGPQSSMILLRIPLYANGPHDLYAQSYSIVGTRKSTVRDIYAELIFLPVQKN